MTYEKLMKSLDHVDMTNFNILTALFGIIVIIVGFICLIGTNITITEDYKSKSKVKKFLFHTLVTVIFSAITLGGVGLFKHELDKPQLTIKEKQSKENANSYEINDWEDENVPKYLNQLLLERTPIEKYSDTDKHDGTTEVTFVNPETNQKEKVDVDNEDIHKATRSSLSKDEPQETYLQYSIIPKKITYNYPKGKLVNIKLIYVK